MEKNWTEGMSEEAATRLSIKALLEVVDSGSKNMEVAVMLPGQKMRMLTEEELQAITVDIEREQEEAKKSNQEAAAMEH